MEEAWGIAYNAVTAVDTDGYNQLILLVSLQV
jgi:hypothetical protein